MSTTGGGRVFAPGIVAAFAIAAVFSPAGAVERRAPASPPRTSERKESSMTKHAAGPFDVKVAPQTPAWEKDAGPGRMSIDKRFHGDLEAKSRGEMLSVMGTVPGSAGYVAIERVTGVLGGRRGSFALQHSGSMDRGKPALSITVIPDSGTDELAGLTGRMTIDVRPDGKHFYAFEYEVPEER